MGTASSLGQTDLGTKHPKVRKRDPARSSAIGAAGTPAKALEEYRFLPVAFEGSRLCQDWEKKERVFFRSLSFVGALYRFPPTSRKLLSYPRNILCALENAQRHIRRLSPETDLSIFATEQSPAVLATHISFDPPYNMYHFPIEGLYRILYSRRHSKAVRLLLSLLAYVHQVLGVDFYSESQSYIGFATDNIQQMMEEQREDSLQRDFRFIHSMFRKGREVQSLLENSSQLREFEDRLDQYQPRKQVGKALRQIGETALKLYQQFPNQSIIASIPCGLLFQPDTDDGFDPVAANQYLSFVWSTKDWFYDSLLEFINADLQESPCFDAPVDWQLFDKPKSAVTLSLDFERRVFDLFELLAGFLNEEIWKI